LAAGAVVEDLAGSAVEAPAAVERAEGGRNGVKRWFRKN